jgi:hypothetical protein
MRTSRLSLWTVLLLTACGGRACAAGSAAPAPGIQLVRDIAARLPDFELQGAPAVFDSHNLWSHIDGDADRYLAYQFQWAATGMLARRDSGQKVTVDVYRFATDLDAFGACSMDRTWDSVGGLELPGGASPLAAYLEVDQLRLWRGPFAVVISPVRRRGTLVDLSLEVGRAACSVLPPHSSVPRLLRLCPPSGMLGSTLRFQRTNVFGRSWAGNAALAAYGSTGENGRPDRTCELAVFDAGSAPAAAQLRERLVTMLRDGGTCRAFPELAAGAMRATHPQFGEAQLVATGRVVALTHHIREAETAVTVLREVLSRAQRSSGPPSQTR